MFRSGVVVALMRLLLTPALAQAADERSMSNRLDDRRYVISGPRAYEVGTEAGRFPAMGFHTRGEMGGVGPRRSSWSTGSGSGSASAVDGRATRFTSGYGYAGCAPRPGG